MSEAIKIGGVCERDLDLFLQEQLLSSPGFCRWFTREKLRLDTDLGVAESVYRGQTDRTGESDIVARFRLKDGKAVLVYVENKIKAGFQGEQYGRYQDRAKKALRKGEADNYRIVLFAPHAYLQGRQLAGFGSDECIKLAYDEVLEFLTASAAPEAISLPERGRYKAALVSEAIALSSGDSGLEYEEFWQRYWTEVNRIAPEFEYAEPTGPKAAGGDTIEFSRAAWGGAIWPVKPVPTHRLAQGKFGKYKEAPHGEFSIRIPGWGDVGRLQSLKDALKPHLRPHMMVVKANASAAIRIAVPPIKRAEWSTNQVPGLRTAIYLGKDLCDWFLSPAVQAAWVELLERDKRSTT